MPLEILKWARLSLLKFLLAFLWQYFKIGPGRFLLHPNPLVIQTVLWSRILIYMKSTRRTQHVRSVYEVSDRTTWTQYLTQYTSITLEPSEIYRIGSAPVFRWPAAIIFPCYWYWKWTKIKAKHWRNSQGAQLTLETLCLLKYTRNKVQCPLKLRFAVVYSFKTWHSKEYLSLWLHYFCNKNYKFKSCGIVLAGYHFKKLL